MSKLEACVCLNPDGCLFRHHSGQPGRGVPSSQRRGFLLQSSEKQGGKPTPSYPEQPPTQPTPLPVSVQENPHTNPTLLCSLTPCWDWSPGMQPSVTQHGPPQDTLVWYLLPIFLVGHERVLSHTHTHTCHLSHPGGVLCFLLSRREVSHFSLFPPLLLAMACWLH